MSVLDMDPAGFPAPTKALYERMAAGRRAKGEGFGGPYLALLNHPALAERVEALGFYLKFNSVLPRAHYQFIVLSVARTTGAAFEWQDHVQHARAAGLPEDIIDGIAAGGGAALPHPFGLLRDILAKTLAWQPIPETAAIASRRPMGQGRAGRDRGGVRLLSDVCRHKSGLRYCGADSGECGAREKLRVPMSVFTFVAGMLN